MNARVDCLYATIKSQLVSFAIRPDARINEGRLAAALATSRTPVREALNRLVSEGLIEQRHGEGFFCRPLRPADIFELYELRGVLEAAHVRLAAERADDAPLAALRDDLHANGLSTEGKTVGEATAADEAFHEGIAELTGNAAMMRALRRVNERIRFVRWVDMASRVRQTKSEHKAIMDALMAREGDEAARIMDEHIARRMDEIVAAVREGVFALHMAGPETIFSRTLTQ